MLIRKGLQLAHPIILREASSLMHCNVHQSDIDLGALQDYWHHWEDVTAGFLLGLGLAYAFYRLSYPPISSHKAGEPILPPLEAGSNAEGTPQRVRYTDLEAATSAEPQQL